MQPQSNQLRTHFKHIWHVHVYCHHFVGVACESAKGEAQAQELSTVDRAEHSNMLPTENWTLIPSKLNSTWLPHGGIAKFHILPRKEFPNMSHCKPSLDEKTTIGISWPSHFIKPSLNSVVLPFLARSKDEQILW